MAMSGERGHGAAGGTAGRRAGEAGERAGRGIDAAPGLSARARARTQRRVERTLTRGRGVLDWLQRTRPVRTVSHFTDVGGNVLAGGMSFQALFAVFAGLWVGFGVFGIVLKDRPELLTTLIEQLNLLVPGLVGSDPQHSAVQLDALLNINILGWGSIVAGASLLWIALNWFTGTRRSIRIIFGLEVKQYRNVLLLKLRDFTLAICFALAIVVSASLTVLSSNLAADTLTWLGMNPENWFFSTVGALARYGAMLLFDVIVLLAMFRYLAEVRVPRLRLISGCLLGGLVLLGLKMLGVVLLGGATSNPLLATFAVLIGLLLWFNFICRALLLTAAWIATGLDSMLGLPSDARSDTMFEI